MVEGARLESVCTETYRGFESRPLRQDYSVSWHVVRERRAVQPEWVAKIVESLNPKNRPGGDFLL